MYCCFPICMTHFILTILEPSYYISFGTMIVFPVCSLTAINCSVENIVAKSKAMVGLGLIHIFIDLNH